MRSLLAVLATLLALLPVPVAANSFGQPESPAVAPRVALLGADRAGLLLALDLPAPRTRDVTVEGRSLRRWSLAGESGTREPGWPELPVLARLLATDGAGLEVRVREAAFDTVEGVDLAPFVERPTRCGRPGRPGFCDPAAYALDAFLPADWARGEDAGTLRGVPLGRLVVHPVRYNAARRQALVARRLVVEVAFPPAPAGAGWRSRGVSPSDDAVLRRAALNWAAARDGAPQVPDRVLAVVAEGLEEALQPWVDWKRRKGLAVDVLPMAEAGADAEALKARVQAAWNGRSRPTALLLVGDAEGVPPLRGADGCASDWRFAQLDGDDAAADLKVSRLSARTPAELAVQVARILALEATPPTGPQAAWLPSATLVSSSESAGGPSDDDRCDDLAAVLERHGYGPVDRLYRSRDTDRAEAISAALQAGRGLVAYLGHGDGDSWATTVPPFGTAAVAALDNPGRFPFVMDVSCANGSFDRGECLAEAFLRAGTPDRPLGALGMFSASTDTAWDEPAVMAQGFVEALLDGRRTALGDALEAGRARVLEQFGDTEETRLVLQQYVLFGDGTTDLRTRVPGTLAVSHPAAVPVGPSSFAVAVSDGAGPVPGALVALRKEGEAPRAAFADGTGNALFPLETEGPGTLEVTVTAPDMAPHASTAAVQASGCAVLQVQPAAVACDGVLELRLWDRDLDRDPGAVDLAVVRVSAPSGPAQVTLPETGPSTGAFEGLLFLGPGGLPVAHGDRVQATFDDGDCGGDPREVAAAAEVDCRAPVPSGVSFEGVSFDRVTVRLQTDEAARVQAGLGPAPGVEGVRQASGGTGHVLAFRGLAPATDHFLTLRAWDAAGNVRVAADPAWVVRTAGCTPDCAGKSCGDDGCGGTCGPGCQAGQRCEAGACAGGAGCASTYNPAGGAAACQDCACREDPWCCDAWDGTCALVCDTTCGGCGTGCVPACGDRACGDNGCGGACGTCPEGLCSPAGACVPSCTPDCAGKACGDDGCGGACGLCRDPCSGDLDDRACEGGACRDCCPSCEGKACGDDGCGGACGSCPDPCTGQDAPWLCEEGACRVPCCPSCEGRECGDDGCGGTCGACGPGRGCGPAGRCEGGGLPEGTDDGGGPDAGHGDAAGDGPGPGDPGAEADPADPGLPGPEGTGDEGSLDPGPAGDAAADGGGGRGGGGCASGRAPDGTGPVLLLLLAVLGTLARPRRGSPWSAVACHRKDARRGHPEGMSPWRKLCLRTPRTGGQGP